MKVQRHSKRVVFFQHVVLPNAKDQASMNLPQPESISMFALPQKNYGQSLGLGLFFWFQPVETEVLPHILLNIARQTHQIIYFPVKGLF